MATPPINPHNWRKMEQAQDNMRRALNFTLMEFGDIGEGHTWRWNGTRSPHKALRRQKKWARQFRKWVDKLIIT